MSRPWEAEQYQTPQQGGWQPVAPSAIAFGDGYGEPKALDFSELGSIAKAFGAAASRAQQAGFDVVEIHAAHGYLLHQFLSPLANRRSDFYGGSFPNRIRLLLEVIDAVRKEWPENLPVFVRISATDWSEGGWTLEESVALARHLKAHGGTDLIDVSSGGLVPNATITTGPGYQVPFAEAVRNQAGIATGAVGLITLPQQAEEIVQSEKADLIFLAREVLRNPYWPLQAAQVLGAEFSWPTQYLRSVSRGTQARQPVSYQEISAVSGSK